MDPAHGQVHLAQGPQSQCKLHLEDCPGVDHTLCTCPEDFETDRPETPTPYIKAVLDHLGYEDANELGYAKSHLPSHPPKGEVPRGNPLVACSLLGRLTKGIIDTGCAFSYVTTGLLDRLFPGRYRKWLAPKVEDLDSATYHKLPIIGRIPEALLQFGSVRRTHDLHVSEQPEPNLLLGNDLIYDDISYIEGKYILIRKGGSARECIPIEYGAPVMYGTLIENVNLEPHESRKVCTTIQLSPTAHNTPANYLEKLKGVTVSVERIRRKNDHPSPFPAPLVDHSLDTVDDQGLILAKITNPFPYALPLEQGARVSLVTPMRMVKENGTTYFLEAQTSAMNCEELLEEEEDSFATEMVWPPNPLTFFMHSHEEDLRDLLEGSQTGHMPLPPGFEAPAFPVAGDEDFKIEDIKTPYLSEEQREEILEVCRRFPKAWAKNEADVGLCTFGEVTLDTGDSPPIADPYRPIGKAYVKEATEIIQNMQRLGIIEERDSPWGANLIIAMKPTGKIRICVDLRSMNKCLKPTSKSAFPIPQVEQSLEMLSRAEVTSKIDLQHAYWTLGLKEESKAATAFYFLGRVFCFSRCPFGGSSIPSIFCSWVAKMLRGLEETTFAYFDDVLSMSTGKTWLESWKAHLSTDLPAVLERIEKAGFKCRPSKCQLGVPKGEKIDWLGHIIVSQSLLCDPAKVKSISEAPRPRNAKELLRLLSAASFLRRSIPDFAEICHPLYELTKQGVPYDWTPDHQARLELLQYRTCHAPALRLPRWDADLVVTSDSSQVACGGMLSMIVDDEDGKGPHRVACGYVSRKYTEPEAKRWTIVEMELAALIYTIQSWAYYLEGRPFTAEVDASPLIYLHKFKHSNPRLLRQSLWLQGYDFKIIHQKCKSGSAMAVADYLSRQHEATPSVSLSWQNLRNPVFNAIVPPPWWPEEAVTQEEFAVLADKFYETFEPEFPEETQPLEKLKISHHIRPSEESQEKVFEYERNHPRESYGTIRRHVKKVTNTKLTDNTNINKTEAIVVSQEPPKEDPSPHLTGPILRSQEPPKGDPLVELKGQTTPLPITTPPQVTETIVDTSSHTPTGEKHSVKLTPNMATGAESLTTPLAEPPSEDRVSLGTPCLPDTPCPSLTSSSVSLSSNSQTTSAQENLLPVEEPESTVEEYLYSTEVLENLPWSPSVFLVPTAGEEDKGDRQNTSSNKTTEPLEDTLADKMMRMEGFIAPEKMAVLQQQDATISRIFKRIKETKQKPGGKKNPYTLRQGVLIKVSTLKDGRTVKRVVVPFALQNWLLRMVHGDQEHLGTTQMTGILNPAFYWPNMHRDIATFTASCLPCQYSRASAVKQVETQHRKQPPPQAPNHQISIDLITGLPRSSSGHQYILTIVDQFSRFVQCVALTDKTPQQVAKALAERWYGIIGVPGSVHSDQGGECDSGFMQRVMKILGVRKSRTASYSPQGNSIAELMNRTVGTLLKASVFPNKTARFWPKLLPYICLAINESPTVTGYSPRELLLGKTPSYHRLPLVAFNNEMVTHDDFLQATRLGQEFMWNVVRALQDRPRPGKDVSQRSHSYKEGDFVLLKDLTIGKPGESKLRPRYLGPYRILKAYDAVVLIKRWVGPEDKVKSLALLHHHQLDAKHADVRLAHIRHIKEFKNPMKIGAGPAINPLIIDNFLRQLGFPKLQNSGSPREQHQYDWDLRDAVTDPDDQSNQEENSSAASSDTRVPSPIPGGGPHQTPARATVHSGPDPIYVPPPPPVREEVARANPSIPSTRESTSNSTNDDNVESSTTNGVEPLVDPGLQEPNPEFQRPSRGTGDSHPGIASSTRVGSGTTPEPLAPQDTPENTPSESTNSNQGRPTKEETTSGSKSSRFNSSPAQLNRSKQRAKSTESSPRSHSADPKEISQGADAPSDHTSVRSEPSYRRIPPTRKSKSVWLQNWPDIRALELAPTPSGRGNTRRPKHPKGPTGTELPDPQVLPGLTTQARVESWLGETPAQAAAEIGPLTTRFETEQLAEAKGLTYDQDTLGTVLGDATAELNKALIDKESTKDPESLSTHDYVNETKKSSDTQDSPSAHHYVNV